MEKDPKKTSADLGRAYWAHHSRLLSILRPRFLNWVSISVLEGIEQRAKVDEGSRISNLHSTLMDMLSSKDFSDEADQKKFRAVYEEADALTHPAAVAFLKHAHAINDLTRNHSLVSVDLEILRAIDLLAHDDPTYKDFVLELMAKVSDKVPTPNIVSYNQFFEIYCEAMTLRHLRAREGLQVARVPEAGKTKEKRPDFQCWLDEDTTFFIEVKTLDIVGGEFRHNEMMIDAMDVQIDLDRQVHGGAKIAIAESEIDAYRSYGETDGYDPRSLIRVIDTFRGKFQQAFKPGQFDMGPTFALAVADRLDRFGRQCDFAPYYFDQPGQTCISGTFWHAVYGTPGTPIFRHPDFEGKPSLEGHLTKPGYFVDVAQPFGGSGLIILTNSNDRRVAYGLAADGGLLNGWTKDQTNWALDVICDFHNDGGNTNGYRVSAS